MCLDRSLELPIRKSEKAVCRGAYVFEQMRHILHITQRIKLNIYMTLKDRHSPLHKTFYCEVYC